MAEINNLADVRTEMNNLVARVDSPDYTTILRNTLTEFEYQGLNVLGIVQEIFRRGQIAGKQRQDIQSDITTMIILFLCRGNNVDKMLLKTNEIGKTRIAALKLTYNLANNVGRGGNTVVTLSRVAAVFPVATLRVLNNPDVSIPRAVNLSSGDFGDAFPKAMQTVIAASVFPKSAIGLALMKALLLYLIEENKLLSNVAGVSDADILARVIPFARASLVSSIVPEAGRLGICETLGLVVAGQANANIALAVAAFGRKHPNADLTFVN